MALRLGLPEGCAKASQGRFWSSNRWSAPRCTHPQVEHDEFMRVLAVNHARELEDMQMQAAALTINDKYKEELQAQIASNEERKRKEREVRVVAALAALASCRVRQAVPRVSGTVG